MASKNTSEVVHLTDREMEILKLAWKCMKQAPEIDYAKLASECGMSNIRSASNAWGKIKNKLFTSEPAGPAEKGGTVATGRKRKAAVMSDTDPDTADGEGGEADKNGTVTDSDNNHGENGDNAKVSFTAVNGRAKRQCRGRTSQRPKAPRATKSKVAKTEEAPEADQD